MTWTSCVAWNNSIRKNCIIFPKGNSSIPLVTETIKAILIKVTENSLFLKNNYFLNILSLYFLTKTSLLTFIKLDKKKTLIELL